MTKNPSLTSLEDEERAARNRLAVYKARLYAAPPMSLMRGSQRLAELERRWQLTGARLERAHREQTASSRRESGRPC